MQEFDYHHLKEPTWGTVTSTDFDSNNRRSGYPFIIGSNKNTALLLYLHAIAIWGGRNIE